MGIGGRGPDSHGAALVIAFGVPFAVDANALLALKPPAVLEATSRDAVRTQLVPTLAAGVPVIAPSAKALADDGLQKEAEASAAKSGALLYAPSRGIGGLDAPKAACSAGVDEVCIEAAKAPAS